MLKKIFKFMITFITAMSLGFYLVTKKMKKILNILGAESARKQRLCDMFSEWVTMKTEGKEIYDYLKCNGYNIIAIYGMNYIGEILLKDLEHSGSGVQVKYAIDKNAECIRTEVAVLKPDDELPIVDAVVVTAVAYFDEIKSILEHKIQCPVISLEEILSQ